MNIYFKPEMLTELSGNEMSGIEGGLALPRPFPLPYPTPFPFPKPFPLPDPMPWPLPDTI
ncbi:hypothetical protein SAMN04515674_106142 [Pseudarcicella hirudinis]|uniref:Uncharacterized protein n=1 Tax=Pseudarcicella hirudinis TaxID=1079859 RepID=A0A1I5TRM2_9BACT|nr:hypothetical protein [Pseudarcicella hirudinis]SFP84986.1 hypothetical protein SAMN04515674_106142 [Pseudarcicella hirudinis]